MREKPERFEMKVAFLGGYRGWATDEVYFAPGEETEVTPEIAVYLQNTGFAVIVGPGPIEATQAATELAAKHGIDLSKVAGSGTDGRILIGDVKAHVDAEPA